jgi:hypothetical protein
MQRSLKKVYLHRNTKGKTPPVNIRPQKTWQLPLPVRANISFIPFSTGLSGNSR